MSGIRVPVKTIQRVKRMLKADDPLSHRLIAKEVGISKTTVDAVAAGKWKPKKLLPRMYEPEQLKEPVYCEACERMIVVLPCVACEARRMANWERAKQCHQAGMLDFLGGAEGEDPGPPNMSPCVTG
ncbi:MAG: hypothetical protein GY832_01420 [Chloroflexi bacterium]|nr:hypothetical protein [Chloroflexota bacterium]